MGVHRKLYEMDKSTDVKTNKKEQEQEDEDERTKRQN